jgi:hypothetical protein
MKNIVIIFLLTLTTGLPAFAQTCGAGGITLSTQADIDNFAINYPGCTQTLGYVLIEGADITNLNGLSGLTAVGGALIIRTNPALTSLSGLSALTSVGAYLEIRDNDALTNLSGLSALTSVGAISITKNDALTNLSGLSALTSVGTDVYIIDNVALTNLSGLSALTTVGNSLYIVRNPVLTMLSSLSALSTVGNSLYISNNTALVNINELAGLTNVQTVYIESNNALANLSGLSGITSLAGDLNISSNYGLTSLTGLSALTSIGGSLSITSNGVTNLNALSSLTSVGGSLTISGSSSLTNITGLSGITSVGGFVSIIINPLLTSLTGLENINPSTITNLQLRYCNSLSVCELPNICSYLSVPSNPATINDNAANCVSRAAVLAACQALPVELISFTGKQLEKHNVLVWVTASEINNDYFEIERSANGVTFETIGIIKGANNKQQHQYEYRDEHPFVGINYYRLKQVDTDGKFAYSDIIILKNTHKGEVGVYPRANASKSALI